MTGAAPDDDDCTRAVTADRIADLAEISAGCDADDLPAVYGEIVRLARRAARLAPEDAR